MEKVDGYLITTNALVTNLEFQIMDTLINEGASDFIAQRQFLEVQSLHPKAKLPVRSTAGAAGLDLYSIEDVHLDLWARACVPTGIAIALPAGIYGRIAPRSGLALWRGIDALAGVVDPDYRGELQVLLMNNGDKPQFLAAGSRIAQLILERYVHLESPLQWSESLPVTVRDADGLGSTGLH